MNQEITYEEWDKFYEKFVQVTTFDAKSFNYLKDVINCSKYVVAMPKNMAIALLDRLGPLP